jgi:hypothetical protein
MSVSQSSIWYVRAKWSLAPYGTDNKFKWDMRISKENSLLRAHATFRLISVACKRNAIGDHLNDMFL